MFIGQFYLHEVTEQKKYLDRAFLTRRGVTPAQNPGTLLTLLDNIISVNSPVLCPMNENGEPATLVFILDKIIEKEKENEGGEISKTYETLVAFIKEPLDPKDNAIIFSTSYTKDEIDKYINWLIRNNRLLYLNEKKLHTQDNTGIYLPNATTLPLTGANTNNLHEYKKNINKKRMKSNGLFLKDIPEKEKELSDYHTENILQLARSKEFLRVKDNLFGDKSQATSKDLSNLEQEILDNGTLVTLNSYLSHLQYLSQNHLQTSHSDVYHITKSNIILNNNNNP